MTPKEIVSPVSGAKTVEIAVGEHTSIPRWNDALDPATGQETVLAVLQEMIDGC